MLMYVAVLSISYKLGCSFILSTYIASVFLNTLFRYGDVRAFLFNVPALIVFIIVDRLITRALSRRFGVNSLGDSAKKIFHTFSGGVLL